MELEEVLLVEQPTEYIFVFDRQRYAKKNNSESDLKAVAMDSFLFIVCSSVKYLEVETQNKNLRISRPMFGMCFFLLPSA